MISEKSTEPKFLKKSATLYKIYGGLVVFAIVVSVFIKPLLYQKYNQLTDLIELFIGLPFLIMVVLAPIGLYYSWMSYKREEGYRMTRLKYLLGHLFFCLLILFFLGVFITDISILLN